MRSELGALPLFRLRSHDPVEWRQAYSTGRLTVVGSLLPAPCSPRFLQKADVRFFFCLAFVFA
jgi:hypothetical protein